VTPGARHRLVALGATVVIGVPAFVFGGTYWVSEVTPAEALARFRAQGGAGVAPAGLPETGVYRYRTTGGEHISFLDYRRDYPSTTVRVVTARGCGVRETQWFLEQHVEYYDRCGGGLAAYGTDIAYWWTHGTQDFKCSGGSFDAAGMQAGETARWRCADEDTLAEQETTYVGDEDVSVGGGVPLAARHTRWVTRFSGATEGTATVDDWFNAANGLVLRESRNIGLKVGSVFVGDVTYVDISSFALESLSPSR
jgi:hypothetical protein